MLAKLYRTAWAALPVLPRPAISLCARRLPSKRGAWAAVVAKARKAAGGSKKRKIRRQRAYLLEGHRAQRDADERSLSQREKADKLGRPVLPPTSHALAHRKAYMQSCTHTQCAHVHPCLSIVHGPCQSSCRAKPAQAHHANRTHMHLLHVLIPLPSSCRKGAADAHPVRHTSELGGDS